MGDGTYVSYIAGGWVLTHYPEALACNVCRLVLRGNEELTAFALRTKSEVIDQTILGTGFDPGL